MAEETRRGLWEDVAGMRKYLDDRLSGKSIPPPHHSDGRPHDVIMNWLEHNTHPEMKDVYRSLLEEKLASGATQGLSGLLCIGAELRDEAARDKVLRWAFPGNQLSPDFLSIHTAGFTRNYSSIGWHVINLMDATTGNEGFDFYKALISQTRDAEIALWCLLSLYTRREGREEEANEAVSSAVNRLKGQYKELAKLGAKFLKGQIR